jgi:DNA modification methylase
VWTDIKFSPLSKERLDYPTQKPEELLERIILASSNPKDLVVDFYLGGGTTIVVAEKLERTWIGIDINPRAIEISEKRLIDLGQKLRKDFIISGIPKIF